MVMIIEDPVGLVQKPNWKNLWYKIKYIHGRRLIQLTESKIQSDWNFPQKQRLQ